VEHQSLFQTLKQAVVLYLASVYFLIPMTVYGLVFFMPSQIAAVVHRKVGFEVGLISSILWIAALIATIVFPALSDRTGKRAQLDALLGISACGDTGTDDPELVHCGCELYCRPADLLGDDEPARAACTGVGSHCPHQLAGCVRSLPCA
jgi:hypothetical protein